MSDRWTKLTDEQLQGANYALRVFRTWPGIRGAALEMLEELLEEVDTVRVSRAKERKGREGANR